MTLGVLFLILIESVSASPLATVGVLSGGYAVVMPPARDLLGEAPQTPRSPEAPSDPRCGVKPRAHLEDNDREASGRPLALPAARTPSVPAWAAFHCRDVALVPAPVPLIYAHQTLLI